jgi:hypothetical protein
MLVAVSILDGVIFSIYLILPAALGPGVYSASNRNEYQKHKNYVKCGRCIGLTTLPPSVSRLSRQCEILNISQPYRPPRPVMGIALLFMPILLAETIEFVDTEKVSALDKFYCTKRSLVSMFLNVHTPNRR